MKKYEKCKWCNGTGVEHSPDYPECLICGGYGVIIKKNYYNRNKSFSYKAVFYSYIGIILIIIYLVMTN